MLALFQSFQLLLEDVLSRKWRPVSSSLSDSRVIDRLPFLFSLALLPEISKSDLVIAIPPHPIFRSLPRSHYVKSKDESSGTD